MPTFEECHQLWLDENYEEARKGLTVLAFEGEKDPVAQKISKGLDDLYLEVELLKEAINKNDFDSAWKLLDSAEQIQQRASLVDWPYKELPMQRGILERRSARPTDDTPTEKVENIEVDTPRPSSSTSSFLFDDDAEEDQTSFVDDEMPRADSLEMPKEQTVSIPAPVDPDDGGDERKRLLEKLATELPAWEEVETIDNLTRLNVQEDLKGISLAWRKSVAEAVRLYEMGTWQDAIDGFEHALNEMPKAANKTDETRLQKWISDCAEQLLPNVLRQLQKNLTAKQYQAVIDECHTWLRRKPEDEQLDALLRQAHQGVAEEKQAADEEREAGKAIDNLLAKIREHLESRELSLAKDKFVVLTPEQQNLPKAQEIAQEIAKKEADLQRFLNEARELVSHKKFAKAEEKYNQARGIEKADPALDQEASVNHHNLLLYQEIEKLLGEAQQKIKENNWRDGTSLINQAREKNSADHWLDVQIDEIEKLLVDLKRGWEYRLRTYEKEYSDDVSQGWPDIILAWENDIKQSEKFGEPAHDPAEVSSKWLASFQAQNNYLQQSITEIRSLALHDLTSATEKCNEILKRWDPFLPGGANKEVLDRENFRKESTPAIKRVEQIHAHKVSFEKASPYAQSLDNAIAKAKASIESGQADEYLAAQKSITDALNNLPEDEDIRWPLQHKIEQLQKDQERLASAYKGSVGSLFEKALAAQGVFNYTVAAGAWEVINPAHLSEKDRKTYEEQKPLADLGATVMGLLVQGEKAWNEGNWSEVGKIYGELKEHLGEAGQEKTILGLSHQVGIAKQRYDEHKGIWKLSSQLEIELKKNVRDAQKLVNEVLDKLKAYLPNNWITNEVKSWAAREVIHADFMYWIRQGNLAEAKKFLGGKSVQEADKEHYTQTLYTLEHFDDFLTDAKTAWEAGKSAAVLSNAILEFKSAKDIYAKLDALNLDDLRGKKAKYILPDLRAILIDLDGVENQEGAKDLECARTLEESALSALRNHDYAEAAAHWAGARMKADKHHLENLASVFDKKYQDAQARAENQQPFQDELTRARNSLSHSMRTDDSYRQAILHLEAAKQLNLNGKLNADVQWRRVEKEILTQLEEDARHAWEQNSPAGRNLLKKLLEVGRQFVAGSTALAEYDRRGRRYDVFQAVKMSTGRLDKMESLLHQLEILTDKDAPDEQADLSSMKNKVEAYRVGKDAHDLIYNWETQPPEKLHEAQEALEKLKANNSSLPPDSDVTLALLAKYQHTLLARQALIEQGDYESAYGYYKKALENDKASGGEEATNAVNTLDEIINAFYIARDTKDPETQARQLVSIKSYPYYLDTSTSVRWPALEGLRNAATAHLVKQATQAEEREEFRVAMETWDLLKQLNNSHQASYDDLRNRLRKRLNLAREKAAAMLHNPNVVISEMDQYANDLANGKEWGLPESDLQGVKESSFDLSAYREKVKQADQLVREVALELEKLLNTERTDEKSRFDELSKQVWNGVPPEIKKREAVATLLGDLNKWAYNYQSISQALEAFNKIDDPTPSDVRGLRQAIRSYDEKQRMRVTQLAQKKVEKADLR